MEYEIAHKIKSLISKELLSESEVNHVLSLMRKYLEHMGEDEQEQYILLKFFCDWSQHIAIDRSVPAMEILKKLNDTIVKLQYLNDPDKLREEITEVISFLSFKEQIRKILTNMGLEAETFNDRKKWENFIRHYINIILNCPLILPKNINGKIKIYHQAIISNPIKVGMWVVGFSITRPDKSIFKNNNVSSYAKFLSLVILTSDTTRIVIPLTPEKILGWKLVGQNVFPHI